MVLKQLKIMAARKGNGPKHSFKCSNCHANQSASDSALLVSNSITTARSKSM